MNGDAYTTPAIDPATCDEAMLNRLSVSMNLPREAGEDVETYRARVVAAWPTRPNNILGAMVGGAATLGGG